MDKLEKRKDDGPVPGSKQGTDLGTGLFQISLCGFADSTVTSQCMKLPGLLHVYVDII